MLLKYSDLFKFELLRKNNIGNPPWNYYFLKDLNEKEYPKYLAKLFKLNTGENLPLTFDFKNQDWIINKKKLKTFNQKIQWIKLYGITDLMRDCTDKVKVRDYVCEHIGAEYLKPVLQIIPNNNEDVTTYFEQINWEQLPESFVIKCNHGCKWHYIIKNKNDFLKNKRLFNLAKQKITGFLEQNFCWWGGFELQYSNIKPKILIEELFDDFQELEINCFNGKPKIIKKVHNDIPNKLSMYDENLNSINLRFLEKEFLVNESADDTIKQTIDLSKKLAKTFYFVRIDWMIKKNKIYFNEVTFTPNSGLIAFDKSWNLKLGKLIKIKE